MMRRCTNRAAFSSYKESLIKSSTHLTCIFSVILHRNSLTGDSPRGGEMSRSDRGDGSFEQPACKISIQSDEKSDCAIYALDLISDSNFRVSKY